MELLAALVILDIGAVNTDNVSNLAHNWAVLKSAGIDDNHRVVSVLLSLITLRVVSAINDFE